MKAFIYARQSTKAAAKTERGDSLSIAEQIKTCHEYATAKGWEVVAKFEDSGYNCEAYPATEAAQRLAAVSTVHATWLAEREKNKDKRPAYRDGLGELINRLHEVKDGVVIVYNTDRLLRTNVSDFLGTYLTQCWQSQNVKIVDACTGQTKDSNNWLEVAVDTLISAQKNEDYRRKSQAAIQAKKAKWLDGHRIGGRVYWGYTKGNRKAQYIPSAEADDVREAFDRLNRGELIADIVRWLNAKRGEYSPEKYASGATAIGTGAWTRSTLVKAFKHPEYCGLMKDPDGNLIPSKDYTALVAKEIWEKAQKILAGRIGESRKRKYFNALTGIVKCGYCGRQMVCAARDYSDIFDKMETGEKYSRFLCRSKSHGIAKQFCDCNNLKLSINDTPTIDTVMAGNALGILATPTSDFGKHCHKAIALTGKPPADFAPEGLYEMVMPLLAMRLIEKVNLRMAGNDAQKEQEEAVKSKTAAEDQLKRLGKVYLNGGIDEDEYDSKCAELKSTITQQEVKIAACEAAMAERSEAKLQQIFAWLEQLQYGTISPAVLQSLLWEDLPNGKKRHAVINAIVVFASYIKIEFVDGGTVDIERVIKNNGIQCPQHSLDIYSLNDGRFFAKIRYYYNSYFDGANWGIVDGIDGETEFKGDVTTVFSGNGITIQTCGETTSPGKASKRYQQRHKRATRLLEAYRADAKRRGK